MSEDRMIQYSIVLARTCLGFMIETGRDEGVPEREMQAMVILAASLLVSDIARTFSSSRSKAQEGLDMMFRTAESALDKAYENDRREVH